MVWERAGKRVWNEDRDEDVREDGVKDGDMEHNGEIIVNVIEEIGL